MLAIEIFVNLGISKLYLYYNKINAPIILLKFYGLKE
jgi:hypothetical protein